MTDQDIIQAAFRAGLCFPVCWSLCSEIFPEQDISCEWSKEEHERMAQLRRFAELIQALRGKDFDR